MDFRILVVDDNQQIRQFLDEYVLKPGGFSVEFAFNGAAGLEKILADPPDLVLLDYEMPLMTGVEMLRELRRQSNQTPVILMTSHGSEQVAIETFRLGVSDYIIKPFNADEMLKAVNNAIAVTRLQREKEELVNRIMLVNQSLQKRLEELNVLYRVGKSITALTEQNKMLERIVDAVLYVTKSEECSLSLFDPRTGQFREQIKKDRAGNHRNRADERLLSVPLQIGQKVVGTLSVHKQINGQFTDHDNRLLRMLADYSAIAVHNLQLMRQLHMTKEREKQQIRNLFERYVAPTVVEQILAEPDLLKLGGVRQPVTVLFADVRGFSTFSTKIPPETLVELLNQYLRVAADAVLAEEGTLDKFMGDAVMAFFNAPLPQPDHTLRAVRAAWAMRQAVAQLHTHLPPEYRLEFGVGVGVGEAVVGNIGTAQMMNYTVMGDDVNKAKRLQENAEGGQILINHDTYELVHPYVQVRSIGSLRLKGQSQPEPIYEVLALQRR
jgi:class 3 adenylate cyclase/DNA-binding response OmpR family regulator